MPDTPLTPSPAAASPNLRGRRVEGLGVLKWPDPRLMKVSQPVRHFDDALRRIAQRMFDLMRAHGGVGLAAPQVGLDLRLFIMNESGEPPDDRIYINPALSDLEGAEEAEEGCLSLPDVKVTVTRPTARALIRAQDLSGQTFEQAGEGFITRVWQHEIDHLDGKLIIDKDRMGPVDAMTNRKLLRNLEADYARLTAPRRPALRLPF